MVAKSCFDFFKRLTRDYFSNGYYYYFVVEIPEHRTAEQVSKKLTEDYKVSNHSEIRNRRKKAGKANCNFVIFKNICVIVATEGEHETLKRRQFKDIRKKSLIIENHELKTGLFQKGGRLKTTVCLPQYRYRAAERKIEAIALHSVRKIVFELKNFSPYTFEGIQNQRYKLIEIVNSKRKRARLQPIKWQDTKPFWAKN
jgi:hypothetical protein